MARKSDTIEVSEFTQPTLGELLFGAFFLTFLFGAGLAWNIYALIGDDEKWDGGIMLLGIDLMIVVGLFAFMSKAMGHNCIPELEVVDKDDWDCRDFPQWDKLQEHGFAFAGTLILKYGIGSTYVEVIMPPNGEMVLTRELNSIAGQKSLGFRTFSICEDGRSITVKNEVAPPHSLDTDPKQFAASLPLAKPGRLLKLHLELLDAARAAGSHPRKLRFEEVGPAIIRHTTEEVEWQQQLGLTTRVAEGDYRITLKAVLKSSFRAWHYMVFEMARNRANAWWVKRFKAALASR